MRSPFRFRFSLPLLAAAIVWAVPTDVHAQEILVVGSVGNQPAPETIGAYTLSGAAINTSLLADQGGALTVSGGDLFIPTSNGDGVAEYTTSGALVNPALVAGLNPVAALAVSGGDLFVATSPGGTQGTVGVYNATTGAPINVSLATGLFEPTAIAVSDGDLFVLSEAVHGSGIISEYNVGTGAVVNPALITGVGQFALATSGSDLFVSSLFPFEAGIGEYTTSGATVNASLISHSGLGLPSGIAIYGNDLFVVNNGTNGSDFPELPASVAEYTTSGATVNADLIDGIDQPTGIAIVTPEPSALLLLAIGAAALAAWRSRKHAPRAVLVAAICALVSATADAQQIVVVGGLGTEENPEVVGAYMLSGAAINTSLISDPYGEFAASAGDLFIPTANGIAEYTTSGALVNPALVTGLNPAAAMAVSGGELFVLEGSGTHSYVSVYDATTGATINASLVPSLAAGLWNPTAIAVSDGDLFILSAGMRGSGYADGVVSQYDASTGALINPALVTGVGEYALAVSGNDLFVPTFPFETGIGEYTTSGATVNASLITGLGLVSGIAIYGNGLFEVNNESSGSGSPGLPASVGEYTLSGATVNAALINGIASPNGIAIITPEPPALVLLAIGIAALAAWRTRDRRRLPCSSPRSARWSPQRPMPKKFLLQVG